MSAAQEIQLGFPTASMPSFETIERKLQSFTPSQVREVASYMVQLGHIAEAASIAETALQANPSSEDLLLIASLIAEVQQNWARAEELLVSLAEEQSPNTPPQTWLHLARVLRCQNKFDDTWLVLDFACSRFPEDQQLKEELLSLEAFLPAPAASL